MAESVSARLKKEAVAGKINGKLVDVNQPIEEDGLVEIITLSICCENVTITHL
ncbi:TGS domain-containing protein [Paenibacillus naphthalenovorans]|uniref:TGS domain-containing protein n=1 Tax=Paenibacillus naphthalenovorans TaxID=162209 RepID=UPI0020C90D6E|nr:TGS domain-containing protein [Paenibacillus naphthalenovorans]